MATLAAAANTLNRPPALTATICSPMWTQSQPCPRGIIIHHKGGRTFAVRKDQWLLVAAKSGALRARLVRGEIRVTRKN